MNESKIPPTIDTPAAPAIRFIGRFDHAEPGASRFAWPGSGIAFRFSGTDAAVRLNEVRLNDWRLDDKAGQYYTVVVNGQRQPTLATQSGERSYPVATGLPAGEHEVFLYRRTEAFLGVSSFIELELGSGKLLAPPPPPARRIEIIGDSFTVGYGIEGVPPYAFSAETENHYLTYGAIAARNLDAELITVAASGKGVIRNYGGDATDPLPKLYDKVLPFPFLYTQRLWDFSWQPHVVVINLGTNDFSTHGGTQGVPSEGAFTNAYKDFIAFLREKNPKAYILCLPISNGFIGYIQNAVAARVASGDTNIEAFTLNFQPTGSGGGGHHPSSETHASMADALTQKLKSAMSW